jgi:hypothetical protein
MPRQRESLAREELPEIDAPHESQPDGGYGWICVAACFIFNAFTWGSVSVRDFHHTNNEIH